MSSIPVIDVNGTLGALLSSFLVADIFTGIATLQAWLYIRSDDSVRFKYLVSPLPSHTHPVGPTANTLTS